MIININENDLKARVALNRKRLETGDYYQFDNIFAPDDYDWYADKEGRALLAFVCHYNMSGEKIPCMDKLMQAMDAHLNSGGYFGPVFSAKIHEQQLSGHSWLLRGLCNHFMAFGDDYSKASVQKIVENLFLPLKGRFHTYPINRSGENTGGVSGSSGLCIGQWILSSDIGCAFMSVDGLSHAYEILKDARIKDLLDEMIDVYLAIDKVTLKVQTHCTLTAARGMMRMYRLSGDVRYLDGADNIWDLYVNGGGMTMTYQNLNWWGRPDTWTEPCAIVDSLMLSCELYKVRNDEKYRVIAARIYHNGLATAQRPNGGAGTDTIILPEAEHESHTLMYEAFFCCTMRFAEGLEYITDNCDLLYAQTEGNVAKNGYLFTDGDIIYAQVTGLPDDYPAEVTSVDGYDLMPIVNLWKLTEEQATEVRQKILFDVGGET